MNIKIRLLLFALSIFLLTLPSIAFPQQKVVPKNSELMNIKQILETVCFDKLIGKSKTIKANTAQ